MSVTVAEGAGITVKLLALVPLPPGAATMMGPVVAPAGTTAVICPAETTAKLAAAAPLKLTAEASARSAPLMATAVPTRPDIGGLLPMKAGNTSLDF
jgi:hypothetical protein